MIMENNCGLSIDIMTYTRQHKHMLQKEYVLAIFELLASINFSRLISN